jgi:hypothetical protein
VLGEEGFVVFVGEAAGETFFPEFAISFIELHPSVSPSPTHPTKAKVK